MNIREGKSWILSSTLGVFVFLQQILGTCVSFHIPKIQGTDNTKHCLNWNSFKRKNVPFSDTLQGTNISPKNGILKMIFLFPRWNILISWRVFIIFQGPSFIQFPKGFPCLNKSCLNHGGVDGTRQRLSSMWCHRNLEIFCLTSRLSWKSKGTTPKCPPLPGSNRSY